MKYNFTPQPLAIANSAVYSEVLNVDTDGEASVTLALVGAGVIENLDGTTGSSVTASHGDRIRIRVTATAADTDTVFILQEGVYAGSFTYVIEPDSVFDASYKYAPSFHGPSSGWDKNTPVTITSFDPTTHAVLETLPVALTDRDVDPGDAPLILLPHHNTIYAMSDDFTYGERAIGDGNYPTDWSVCYPALYAIFAVAYRDSSSVLIYDHNYGLKKTINLSRKPDEIDIQYNSDNGTYYLYVVYRDQTAERITLNSGLDRTTTSGVSLGGKNPIGLVRNSSQLYYVTTDGLSDGNFKHLSLGTDIHSATYSPHTDKFYCFSAEYAGKIYEVASDLSTHTEISNEELCGYSPVAIGEYIYFLNRSYQVCRIHTGTKLIDVAGEGHHHGIVEYKGNIYGLRAYENLPSPFIYTDTFIEDISFMSYINRLREEVVTTETVTIAGLDEPVFATVVDGDPLGVTYDLSPEILINGEVASAPAVVDNGDTLAIRLKAPAKYRSVYNVPVVVGNRVFHFSIATTDLIIVEGEYHQRNIYEVAREFEPMSRGLNGFVEATDAAQPTLTPMRVRSVPVQVRSARAATSSVPRISTSRAASVGVTVHKEAVSQPVLKSYAFEEAAASTPYVLGEDAFTVSVAFSTDEDIVRQWALTSPGLIEEAHPQVPASTARYYDDGRYLVAKYKFVEVDYEDRTASILGYSTLVDEVRRQDLPLYATFSTRVIDVPLEISEAFPFHKAIRVYGLPVEYCRACDRISTVENVNFVHMWDDNPTASHDWTLKKDSWHVGTTAYAESKDITPHRVVPSFGRTVEIRPSLIPTKWRQVKYGSRAAIRPDFVRVGDDPRAAPSRRVSRYVETRRPQPAFTCSHAFEYKVTASINAPRKVGAPSHSVTASPALVRPPIPYASFNVHEETVLEMAIDKKTDLLESGYFSSEAAALDDAVNVWGYPPENVYASQLPSGVWVWIQEVPCVNTCSDSCPPFGLIRGG